METSGFVTSLVTSFLVFVLLLLLHFIFTRNPANDVIYYPAKKVKEIPIPYKPGIFGWLREAWSVTEEHIIEHAGLDAAIYMKFLGSGNSYLYKYIFTHFSLTEKKRSVLLISMCRRG